MNHSIQEDRKTWKYRLLEASIGLSSIIFISLVVSFSFFESSRNVVSIFLIIYSFLWVLKLSLNTSYTIYTYNQVRRWEKFNWVEFFSYFPNNTSQAKAKLQEFANKYKDKIDWKYKIENDIALLNKIENTKFQNIGEIYHVNIFSVYNEPAEILIRSLEKIYQAGYNLGKIVVFVSQEARNGAEKNRLFRERISKENWLSTNYFVETELDIVYSKEHFVSSENQEFWAKYKNTELEKIELLADKLNIIFTEHPDGLVGEVKGKASNEDWGSRQASLFVKAKQIDPELVLATSLDADSHIDKYFYHNLSYRFCLEEDRFRRGFQPVHSYSNNFFQTGIWSRQVAAQTTLHNMSQLALEEEVTFFAIYSVPLVVLQQVDFWVREVIAEDSLLFIKCLIHFNGNFKVVPFYGVFEGDAVEADDYFETIYNQYKQLQRWAWGGIEGFPYLFKRFFWDKEKSDIDIRIRLKWAFLLFTNHFFWSSSPILFSAGIILPQLAGGDLFRSKPISQNLSLFSQYFAWVSFAFLAIFTYITIFYIGQKATKNIDVKWYHWALVILQCLTSPLIYCVMGIPALDAQIRGIFGRYLTYLVTPKK